MTFIYSFYFQNRAVCEKNKKAQKKSTANAQNVIKKFTSYTSRIHKKKHENLLEEKISYAIFALRHKINKKN